MEPSNRLHIKPKQMTRIFPIIYKGVWMLIPSKKVVISSLENKHCNGICYLAAKFPETGLGTLLITNFSAN